MFKTFGTSKAVFVNQDEGMFVALALTLDENVLTLETEQEGGRTYVKAGSVVKEGDVVRGITAERFDITDGPVAGRVVTEGYCWASSLTSNALAAASSLPGIVIMPYKAIVFGLERVNSLVAILKVEGAKFASDLQASDFTVSGATVTSATPLADGTLKLTFSQAGDISITAINSGAFTGVTGATVKGLPIKFTLVAGTTNAVTVTAGEHGSASSDKTTAAEGEIVTITASPASQYVVDKVTVNGTEISVTSGAYKFIMPDVAAAVSVTFKAQA